MAFQPAQVGTVQVEMRYTWNGQLAMMCFHVNNITDVPFTDIANVFLDTLHTDLRTIQSLNCLLNDIRLLDIHTQDGPVQVVPVNTAGSVNTASVNNILAPCVTLTTTKRGRSYTGRKYVPGLAVGFQSVNNIDSTAVTTIDGAFSSLVIALLAANVPLSVLSRKLNGVVRPEAVLTTVSNASLKDSILDTQRRRKVGVGP